MHHQRYNNTLKLTHRRIFSLTTPLLFKIGFFFLGIIKLIIEVGRTVAYVTLIVLW